MKLNLLITGVFVCSFINISSEQAFTMPPSDVEVFGRHWYKLSPDAVPYADLVEWCATNWPGSYPAEPEDDLEFQFLLEMAETIGPALRVFLAIDDIAEEDTWITARGNPSEIENNPQWWGGGQPNNGGGVEDCAIFNPANSYLIHDFGCDTDYRTICEFEADKASTCAELAPCTRFTDTCLSKVARQVCMRIITHFNSELCMFDELENNDGAICSASFPPRVTQSNNDLCVYVAPGADAVFTYESDRVSVVTSGPVSVGVAFQDQRSRAVSCRVFDGTASSLCGHSQQMFQITVPTDRCECTCTSWARGTCSVTCGSGIETQTRICIPPAPGSTCTEEVSRSVDCFGAAGNICPTPSTPAPTPAPAPSIICQCARWNSWSPCSRTCNGGMRTKSRLCFKTGGAGSCPTEVATESCNNQPCPTCLCSQWSSWGTCSVTCGNGIEIRTRSCSGTTCPSSLEDRRLCVNINPCTLPVLPTSIINGGWAPWQGWGDCSNPSICIGTRQRQRTCTKPLPSGGGAYCVGGSSQTGPCDITLCNGRGIISQGITNGGQGGGGNRGNRGGGLCQLAKNPRRCRWRRRRLAPPVEIIE